MVRESCDHGEVSGLGKMKLALVVNSFVVIQYNTPGPPPSFPVLNRLDRDFCMHDCMSVTIDHARISNIRESLLLISVPFERSVGSVWFVRAMDMAYLL